MSKVKADRASEATVGNPDPHQAPPRPVELSEEDLEGVAGGGKTFLIFVSGPNGNLRQ